MALEKNEILTIISFYLLWFLNHHWKCNFPLIPPVHLFVGRSVGWSVSRLEVLCSYRSTYLSPFSFSSARKIILHNYDDWVNLDETFKCQPTGFSPACVFLCSPINRKSKRNLIQGVKENVLGHGKR